MPDQPFYDSMTLCQSIDCLTEIVNSRLMHMKCA